MSVRYTGDLRPEQFVDAESITQHPRNPRNGDVEEIIASLHASGCYRPIYVSQETGHILAGHHLYTALLTLGEEQVPVQWVKNLTPDAELRIVLADNQVANLGRMDDAQVLSILDEIGNEGTGYSDFMIEDMRADLATGFFGGAGDLPQDELPSYDREVNCPSCGHTFHIQQEV